MTRPVVRDRCGIFWSLVLEVWSWVLTDPEGTLIAKAQADADLKSGTVKFESYKLDERGRFSVD